MPLDDILSALSSGKIPVEEARRLLSLHAIEEVEGFARVDLNRGARRGVPEVVLAESKRSDEVRKIAERVVEKAGSVVISRMKGSDEREITDLARESGYMVMRGRGCSTVVVHKAPLARSGGRVGILAAGTSDIGVAEESRLVAESMGCECTTGYDVGVAGIHRVMPVLKQLVGDGADAIVVVAGMEGALATVVASLVDIPVIGVPSSVGYGYGGKGVAALASMLQSCSLGLAVVNIDNGVAAGAVAANIANRAARGAAGRRRGGAPSGGAA